MAESRDIWPDNHFSFWIAGRWSEKGFVRRCEVEAGWIRLHRKSKCDWKWQNLEYWRLWETLVFDAAYQKEESGLERGQVKTTVRQLADECEFDRNMVRRFLIRCEREGDITWKRGKRWKRGEPDSDPEAIPERRPDPSIITICNYDKYNPPHKPCEPDSDPKAIPESEPLLNNKKEVQEKSTPPNPPKPRVRVQPPKKLAELKKLLDDIDLRSFKEEWEPQGLDVDACWEDFRDYVLGENPKKPFPNPANWKAFDKAFRNSCKSSVKRGMHLLAYSSSKDPLAGYPYKYYKGEEDGS